MSGTEPRSAADASASMQCLNRFPGAALQLAGDGTIVASNGHVDTLVERALPGLRFAELLEDGSREKWERLLAEGDRAEPACIRELVLVTPGGFALRRFLAVWSRTGAEAVLWLLEYASDAKLETLFAEMSEMHRELVDAQRTLGREKNRLAQALAEAEQAVRARDEVVAIVSHDLRNPLGTIIMAAGVLGLDVPEEAKAQQIAVIKRAAAGMNRLITDLLDVSAIESGRFLIEPEIVPIAPLLEEACPMFAGQTAKKGQRLACSVPPDFPAARADRDRILQVLSNLIGNALKFTPAGGTVTVRGEAVGDEVIVTVEDTGPGVPTADLPHIFDRFWHTRRGRGGGAGLGLAIAKGIVEAHGGRIWARSVPGAGASFSFAIPRAER